MQDITKNMLNKIREIQDKSREEKTVNKLYNGKLNESALDSDYGNEKTFVIRKNDVQFGSVKSAQEESVRKTIGDVTFENDSLVYIPSLNDIVLSGEIGDVAVKFQFRYKDPSGEGCYIWADALQMTDSNTRTIEKIRDAFLNWKQSIVEDGDLIEKLHKESEKNK